MPIDPGAKVGDGPDRRLSGPRLGVPAPGHPDRRGAQPEETLASWAETNHGNSSRDAPLETIPDEKWMLREELNERGINEPGSDLAPVQIPPACNGIEGCLFQAHPHQEPLNSHGESLHSPSLLEQARDAPMRQAVSRLTDLYVPLIRRWLRPYLLQPADADDLVQEVLATFRRNSPGSIPGRKLEAFRSWLASSPCIGSRLLAGPRSATRREGWRGGPRRVRATRRPEQSPEPRLG